MSMYAKKKSENNMEFECLFKIFHWEKVKCRTRKDSQALFCHFLSNFATSETRTNVMSVVRPSKDINQDGRLVYTYKPWSSTW